MTIECKIVRDLHTEMVTACAWLPNGEELLTCSDDESIKRVHADDLTNESVVPKFDGYVTDLSWCPSVNDKSTDTFAVGCSDGTFRIIQASNGREEKRVEAYKAGACISIAWNGEGSALLTGGEDGVVKVFSRVGMLRSTVATTSYPIYCACWGRQDEILFCSGKMLTIEQKERKQIQWKAHEGTILCVEWNHVNNLIVSGGEDCRYRVWDALGRQLFQSQPLENVITSLSWSNNGNYFAVGAFNMLKICDKSGWTIRRNDFEDSGSILSLGWSEDDALVGAGTASGAVVIADIANKTLEYKHITASMKDSRQIEVQNTLEDITETLIFRDRITDMSLDGSYLVVHSKTQVHVYPVNNLSSPQIIDVPSSQSSVLVQGQKVFLAGWTVFTYEGRRVAGKQIFNGINVNMLDENSVTLNDKYLAVLENNRSAIRLVDLVKQAPIGLIKHKLPIVQIALCRHQDDVLAFIDNNGDLFVHLNGKKTFKLPATMVESIRVNDQCDALVALTDGGSKLVVFYYPQVVFIDPDLLPDTTMEEDTPQFSAKQPRIVSFSENLVTIKKQDGSIACHSVSRYPSLLHQLVMEQRKWEDAIRLCRFVDQKFLWAILAAMALKMTHLDTAEIALAATEHVAKLNYMLYIKEIETEKARMAELALYKRDLKSAEQILLHANPPMFYRAIKMNIRLFRWERATQIAESHQPELVRLVELYKKQWETQQILPEAQLKELKKLKSKYSDKPDDDDDDDDNDDEVADQNETKGEDNDPPPSPANKHQAAAHEEQDEDQEHDDGESKY